jgi:uncharacterized membrane protein
VTSASVRRAHFREWERESLWLWPTIAGAVAWFAARLLIDRPPGFVARDRLLSTNIDDARAVLGTIATSILTLTAVVFAIALVALQMVSSQYSPRVLRNFVRKTVTRLALSTFIATFVFALVVLVSLGTSGKGPAVVPVGAIAVAYLLVLVCVVVFVVFVHSTVRSMRVTYVIEDLARGVAQSLEASAPAPGASRDTAGSGLQCGGRLLCFDHRDRVLAGLDVPQLVRLATSCECVLVLRVSVGTYVIRGTPFVEIHGSSQPELRQILACMDLTAVRTVYQDPGYGIRMLVDIAIRALSPAVNDPTTAVQVLDRLAGLMSSVADRPDPTGTHFDDRGQLRVVRPVLSWSRLVDLALTEIEFYGAGSPQVSRRLMAVYEDLETRVGPVRRDTLAAHRRQLVQEVYRLVPDIDRRDNYLHPDPVDSADVTRSRHNDYREAGPTSESDWHTERQSMVTTHDQNNGPGRSAVVGDGPGGVDEFFGHRSARAAQAPWLLLRVQQRANLIAHVDLLRPQAVRHVGGRPGGISVATLGRFYIDDLDPPISVPQNSPGSR